MFKDTDILQSKSINGKIINQQMKNLFYYPSPLSTTIDITVKGNLRQWTHAIELRTQEQGHPNYRRIFQSCGIVIAKQLEVNKEELFPYADWRSDEEISLGRLNSEEKNNKNNDGGESNLT